jgi:phosphatidylinositol alpha-1,6-mannosyltransferase
MDAFLCYSRAAADYVHGMGARADRIFAAGNVTFDAEEFHQRVDLARPRAAEWRQRMELTDRRMVLSVGQLVPRKNHQGLLKAFSMIQKSLGPAALVIVGNGPLKADLERAAASGLSHVIFTGNVQPDELPLYYAAADLFVDLSLRDHWSQVVGEAMAAGLPALVSDADHACELVENGKSGFIVDANDLPAVSSLALSLLASRPKAEAIGEAAFDAVRMHDVRHTLEAFVSCLEGLDVSVLPTPGTTAQGATR